MKWIFFLIVVLPFLSDGQVITTVVGGGTGGLGSGGPATSASLGLFGGLAVDNHGNIFIADGSYHYQRIRKVNATSGLIEVVAGTGVPGYNGDGILATNAQLNNPGNICVDRHGNLYIGDGDNFRIRKVDAVTGIVSTFLGNGSLGYSVDGTPATSSSFLSVSAFTCDDFDNFYFVESRSHRIRKVNSSGILSTIGGTGMPGNSGDGGLATLANISGGPAGICTDKLGNVYFPDSSYAIRKINVATGIITKVAGVGDYVGTPYSGDGISATACHMTMFAVAIDDTGKLFIADYGNHRIVMIDTFGITHTIAGTGISGYSGDGGPSLAAKISFPENVKLDKCNNVYIADFNNQRVRKVTFNPTCLPTLKLNTAIANHPISIYPNPATTELTIMSGERIFQISILDLTGKQIYTQEHNSETVKISVANLPKGIYLIKVNGSQMMRFIKC